VQRGILHGLTKPLHLAWLPFSAALAAPQVIGPDVEYVLSRAQAIQQEQSSPVLTVQHLNSALENVQGGGGGGGGGDQLTKAELEATMKQMLMVSIQISVLHKVISVSCPMTCYMQLG
jgi:hypothetical protein